MSRCMSLIALFAVAALAFAGCNGNNLTPVSGTVTLDGKPVAKASVNFSPKAGGEGAAIGETNETGQYTLRFLRGGESGAVPGEYIVTINKMVEFDTGKKEPDMYDAKKMNPVMGSKNELPEAYNMFAQPKLTATIVKGKNPPIDFQLDSKAK